MKKHIVTYIDQKSTLIEYLSIKQNVDFLLNKKDEHNSNKAFKKYSGGEKRRIAAYVSSLKDSEVIIADEISSSLDKDNALKIMNYLRSIAKNKILIVVTHDKFLINEDDEIIDLSNNVSRKSLSNKKFKYKRYKNHKHYLNIFKYAFFKLCSKIKYVFSFLTSFMVGLTLILLISSLKSGIVSFLNDELLKNFNFEYLLVESKSPYQYGFIDDFNQISDKGVLLMDDIYFDPIKNMLFTKVDEYNVYFELDDHYSMSKELFEQFGYNYEIDIHGFKIYIKSIIDEREMIIHCPESFFEEYYKYKGYKINSINTNQCVLKVDKDLILENYEYIQSTYKDYKFRNSGIESFVYINKMLDKIQTLLMIFIITSLLITFFLVWTIIKLDINEDEEEIKFMKYTGLTNNYIFMYYLVSNYYRGILTFIITIASYYIVITFSNTILRKQLGVNYDILSISLKSCVIILALIIVIISISVILTSKKIKK